MGILSYDVYDGDTWVGGGGWKGVRDVYDVYCSLNGLSDGCTMKFNYDSDHGTYPVYLVPNGGTMGNILDIIGADGISLNGAEVHWEALRGALTEYLLSGIIIKMSLNSVISRTYSIMKASIISNNP